MTDHTELQQRIRNTVNRYTNPSATPDVVKLLAEAGVALDQAVKARQALEARANEPVDNSASGLYQRGLIGPGAVLDEKVPAVSFWYTNHTGKVAKRWVVPLRIWYGETEYYEGPRWFLEAHDQDRNATRNFSLERITDQEPPFHGLTAAQAERYFLAIDEAAGVVQSIARLLRHGPESFDPRGAGISNRVEVANEVGRFKNAVNRMTNWQDIPLEVVREACIRRGARTQPYMHHQQPVED